MTMLCLPTTWRRINECGRNNDVYTENTKL